MTEFLYPPTLLSQLKESFEKYPPLQSDFNIFNKGRLEILKLTYAQLPKIMNHKDYSNEGVLTDAVYNIIQQTPGSIHMGMFIKCIEIMGS